MRERVRAIHPWLEDDGVPHSLHLELVRLLTAIELATVVSPAAPPEPSKPETLTRE